METREGATTLTKKLVCTRSPPAPVAVRTISLLPTVRASTPSGRESSEEISEEGYSDPLAFVPVTVSPESSASSSVVGKTRSEEEKEALTEESGLRTRE